MKFISSIVALALLSSWLAGPVQAFDGHRVKAIKEMVKAKWAKVKPKTPDVKPVEPKPAVKPSVKYTRINFGDGTGWTSDENMTPASPHCKCGRFCGCGLDCNCTAKNPSQAKIPAVGIDYDIWLEVVPDISHKGGDHRFGRFHPLQRFRERFRPSDGPDYSPSSPSSHPSLKPVVKPTDKLPANKKPEKLPKPKS